MPLSFPLEAREPQLPCVPSPPIEKALEKPVQKESGYTKSEYINSEITKLDFFIENQMLKEAKHAYNGLRGMPKELRKKFKYDLKRIRTEIELLEL